MSAVHFLESPSNQVLVPPKSGVPSLSWRAALQEGTQPNAAQLRKYVLCSWGSGS